MYVAIITEDFSQLLQQHTQNLTKVPAKKSLHLNPLIQQIKNGKIKLEPVFPGISNSEMARHYTVSFLKKPTSEEIKQLQKNPAFESFYEKPADELPM